jgi:tetratricopeptide (TPR) repeat protein
MGITLRLLLLAAFAWVGYVILSEAREQAALDQPDNSKVALLFAGSILDGLVIAAIVAFMVVPVLGDMVGGYFFNPGTQIEKDPHSDAISKLARGDPEGAIRSYEEILANDPADTLAISEIARICCRDLEDTARGAAVLEQALQQEWPHEQSSFLANRLADVYMLQHNPMRARQLITEVANSMEGTRYAANAQHRLRDIDRMIESGAQAPVADEE